MKHGKSGHRGSGKWKANRYNPNKPDWSAVHKQSALIQPTAEDKPVVAEAQQVKGWIKTAMSNIEKAGFVPKSEKAGEWIKSSGSQ